MDELTAGGSIFVGRPHTAATEGDAGLTRNHLVVEGSDGSLLGILPTYLSREPGSWEWDHFVRYVARDGGPEGRGGWHPILLGCPSPGYPNSLILHPDFDAGDRASVVAALFRGFKALAARVGAKSSSLMYLDAGSVADLAPLLSDGDAVLWSGADAAIRAGWPSFEAYLAWLPRRRRKEARREMKKFGEAGFDVSAESLKDCYGEIAPPEGNLKRRHGSGLDDAHWARFFANYAAELDDASTVYVCREAGDAVAFSLFSEWGDTVYVRACGFDYGRAGSNAEYFNLCYYLPLAHAIDRDASRLHLGLEAYEAKVSRGAKLEPLWSVVLGPEEPASDWKRPLASFNRGRLDGYEERFAPRAVGELWAPGGAGVRLQPAVLRRALLRARGPCFGLREDRPQRPARSRPATTIRQDIGEGLRHLWGEPVIRNIALMIALTNLLEITIDAQLVLFAKERLGADNFGVGMLYAVAGASIALTSLLADPLRRRLTFGRATAGALMAYGVLAVAMASTSFYWFAVAAWALMMACGILLDVSSLTQTVVPDRLLGRVQSVSRVMALSTAPAGAFLGGIVVERTGNVALVYGCIGAAIFLIALAFSFTALGRATRARRSTRKGLTPPKRGWIPAVPSSRITRGRRSSPVAPAREA